MPNQSSLLSTQLNDLGQLLRQTREAQNLSLADLESRTRIRQRYLAALENGDWDSLPNDVVARGFARIYALALGLAIDEMIPTGANAAPATTTTAPRASTVSEPTRENTYKPIGLDLYGSERRVRRLRRFLPYLLTLIPLIALGYLLVRYGLPFLLAQTPAQGDATVVVVTLPPEGTPPGTPVILVGATYTPTPAPTIKQETSATSTPLAVQNTGPTGVGPSPSVTPTSTPATITQIELALRITQRAWVRILVDDQLQLEQILEPGYEQTFVAQQNVQMRTGNAAGLDITLNGASQPALGDVGEVIELVWTLTGNSIDIGTPTPSPEEILTPESVDGS